MADVRHLIEKEFAPIFGKDVKGFPPIMARLTAVAGLMNWCADTDCHACRANVQALRELVDAFPAREG